MRSNLLALTLHQARDGDARPAGDDLGDLLGPTSSLQQRAFSPWMRQSLLRRLDLSFQLSQSTVAELRAGAFQIGPARPSRCGGALSICSLVAWISWMALFLLLPAGAQRAALLLQIGQLLLDLLQPRRRLASSFSCLSASRSISSCIMRRSISSSSAGLESISSRSRAAASSTRSMALSGNCRSAM